MVCDGWSADLEMLQVYGAFLQKARKIDLVYEWWPRGSPGKLARPGPLGLVVHTLNDVFLNQ